MLAIGIPASLGSLLMSISQIIVNAQMANYDDMALAGIGVAMKVTMMTGMICIGFGQGVQPLLGYCVGAGLWERFQKIMRFSLGVALGLSVVMTGLCYLFHEQIVGVFLTEAAAFDYAVQFTNILLSTSFLFGVFFCAVQCASSDGRRGSGFCYQSQPAGAYLYSGFVYIAGGLWRNRPGLGATGGGFAINRFGFGSVPLDVV